jgi:hypothetical protein
MKATETYLILCQMDAGEITIEEAHDRILRLVNDVKPSEQFTCLGALSGSFTMQDLMLYYQDKEGLDFASKVVDVLNCMVNDR